MAESADRIIEVMLLDADGVFQRTPPAVWEEIYALTPRSDKAAFRAAVMDAEHACIYDGREFEVELATVLQEWQCDGDVAGFLALWYTIELDAGASGTSRLVDVRLNNLSQLAGFSKREDLEYFTEALCGMAYEHMPVLAPTQDMLAAYRKQHDGWARYASRFLDLMASRHIESIGKRKLVGACLLCSEHAPHHCHRRLVAEYLAEKWPAVQIVHL